ncbi:MAG: nucleotidyl transferase AbiEii/AbiGii toxin family protein [Actinobacteria bacterium]|nr:nucleotidyl transferase AbiEii/AbiGii toxin family protein [Actinomycetota bacterium]
MTEGRPNRPRRLIHDEYGLQDVIDRLDKPAELVERDFALVTIAAQLVKDYEGDLCFKGGFVLRHAYGHERFSKDIDATRREPPRHKFDANEVAESLRAASMRNLIEIEPGAPRTDSGRSLDFDRVEYRGPLGQGIVALEVSYRESVLEPPDLFTIGEPYYEPFEIPVMAINEIVAEKLRALCQRQRPTDLSDLAMIFSREAARLDNATIVRLAEQKFAPGLVRDGDRMGRVEENVEAMISAYTDTIPGLAPDAPDFSSAKAMVLGRVRHLIP